MKEIFLGNVIRQRRLDLGLTQEQLGEGICEQATICRFEKGTQTPTHNRVKALLQRLGLPGNRYFAFISKNEEMSEVLRNDIRKLEVLFYLSNDAERSEIRAHIWSKLSELENIMVPDDQITRQYILYNRVSVDCPIKPYEPAEQIAILTKAIRLTVPRFELDAIHSFHFSDDELNIIGLLAYSYLNMGQNRTAISIYHQLFQYMKKNCLQSQSCIRLFCWIASLYAKTLSAERRYEEAIEIAKHCILLSGLLSSQIHQGRALSPHPEKRNKRTLKFRNSLLNMQLLSPLSRHNARPRGILFYSITSYAIFSICAVYSL